MTLKDFSNRKRGIRRYKHLCLSEDHIQYLSERLGQVFIAHYKEINSAGAILLVLHIQCKFQLPVQYTLLSCHCRAHADSSCLPVWTDLQSQAREAFTSCERLRFHYFSHQLGFISWVAWGILSSSIRYVTWSYVCCFSTSALKDIPTWAGLKKKKNLISCFNAPRNAHFWCSL